MIIIVIDIIHAAILDFLIIAIYFITAIVVRDEITLRSPPE